MKKKIIGITLLTASMLLSGCALLQRGRGSSKNSSSSSSENVTSSDVVSSSNSNSSSSSSSSSSISSSEGNKDKAKWTVMVYMCGSDLESGYNSETGKTNPNSAGLATLDIQEMLSVSGQPNDVNIILETGGAKAWKSTYGISSSKLQRWHVANKQLVKDSELTYASMGLTSTFQSFLEWGLTSYPAEKTGVILWNHGGAMQGVCYDEKKNDDSLLNSEVKAALTNAFLTTGTNKLEFIGYDACLMQVQDIAEFNSNYFNYMVGSQESEAGEGWAYDQWIDDLYANRPTETILKAVCDGFVTSYQNAYLAYGYADDQTQSFLDLSKMSAYKLAFEAFASSLSSKISSYGKSNFQKILKDNVQFYGSTRYTYEELQGYASEYGMSVSELISEYQLTQLNGLYYGDYGYEYFGVFDAKDFLNTIKNHASFSSLSSLADAAINALDDLIVYNKAGTDAGDSSGLSLFFSLGSYCAKGTYYASAQTNFTSWRSVVSSYGV